MKRSKADAVFSEYIRLRDANEDGICFCCTCGKPFSWKDGDCGHFIGRQHKGLRFNELNCHAQCRACNRFNEGRKDRYAEFICKKYGENVLNQLYLAEKQISKMTKFDEYQIYLCYKQQVELLKKGGKYVG